VKCARIHFARSLAILEYLRSRRSSTSAGFRFAAAAGPFDFATQTVDYRLATLLIFFPEVAAHPE